MGTIPTARKCKKCNRFYKALFNKGYYMLCWCDSCDAIVVILKNGLVIFLDNVVLRTLEEVNRQSLIKGLFGKKEDK